MSGALGEHGVAHGHARRAEQARHVGRVAVGLLGAVVDRDLVRRHARGLGQGDHGVPRRSGRRGRVGVEQRLDHHRADDHHQDEGQGGEPARPGPPGPGRPADDRVEGEEEEAAEQGADHKSDELFAEPAAERLARQPIGLLPPPLGVDGPGQFQDGVADREERRDGEAREEQARAALFDCRLGPHQDTAPGDDEGGGDADQPAPEQQPVGALGVVDRLQVSGWGERFEIGVGGGFRIKRHDDSLPVQLFSLEQIPITMHRSRRRRSSWRTRLG